MKRLGIIDAHAVLVGCECSGVVRRAFRACGVDAWSCDILPAADGSPHHVQGDVFAAFRSRSWAAVVAFPPCTFLALSGWHWVYRVPGRADDAARALDFFGDLLALPVPLLCLENPRSAAGWLWPSSQVVRPCWFGDAGTKETHFWLRGLPPVIASGYHGAPVDQVLNVRATGERRRLLRSVFPSGLAAAMAAQWSPIIKTS
jgi:hypothetical protein